MARRFLQTRFVWLGLLVQLASTTSSAGALVLCVEKDGSVAIETRLTQLACCGELANARAESRRGSISVEDDTCVDAPLSLPGALSRPTSHVPDDVSDSPTAFTPSTISLASAVRARLQPPPRAFQPDRTREALSTVVLLV